MLDQGGPAAARCLQGWDTQAGNILPLLKGRPLTQSSVLGCPRQLTVRNLKPSREIKPARNPATRAPKGVTSISPGIPITAVLAKAASWI